MNSSDFPPLYEAADKASLAAQKQYLRVLAANFVLLVGAATMSVINYPHATFAVVQAAFLAASLALVIFLGVKQPQKVWYDTRALAESVKTVTWRYVMRAEPFNSDDNTARGNFVRDLRKIFEDNKEVSTHAIEMPAGELITQVMS
ncbi:DUF4231 domain-containing protein, partial [Bradyrhizobium sp. AS23.2]|uniref:DUF4231 domain-containing protein n=1 Tax=Bradyrhizobium sp. AS23.2 TaxID=1680155 RepID=UPI00095C13FB